MKPFVLIVDGSLTVRMELRKHFIQQNAKDVRFLDI